MTDTMLKEGTIVQPDPFGSVGVRVLGDQTFLSLTFPDSVADAGWQLAEFSGTRSRILVRVAPDGTGFYDRIWDCQVVDVQVGSIETSAREVEGRWSVVAELGEINETMWIARQDQTVTVSV